MHEKKLTPRFSHKYINIKYIKNALIKKLHNKIFIEIF